MPSKYIFQKISVNVTLSLMKTLFAAFLLTITIGAVTPSTATIIPNQIFQFNGVCRDCDLRSCYGHISAGWSLHARE